MDVSHQIFGFKMAVVHTLQGLQPVHHLVVFLYKIKPSGGHRQIPPLAIKSKKLCGATTAAAIGSHGQATAYKLRRVLAGRIGCFGN